MRLLGMKVEMSALYRTLRCMEERGIVDSYWADPVSGPRRRMYNMNSAGHQRLCVLIPEIRNQVAMMEAVLAVDEQKR